MDELLAEVRSRKLIVQNMHQLDDGTWYATLARSQTQPPAQWVTGIAKSAVDALKKALGYRKPKRGDDLI